MKSLLPYPGLIALLMLWNGCKSPEGGCPETTGHSLQDTVSVYDSTLAAEYGADAYGMKKYVMAFLKKGPNRDMDSARAAELQRAHLDNITRLAKEGKLVVAGPFFGEGGLRGIYIFDVGSIEEAEELTNSDPAIKAGRLTMELKEWYGSAALTGLNDLHRKIAKTHI